MRANLEPNIDRVGDQEQDGCDAGDVEDITGDFFCGGAAFVVYCGVEYSRNDEAETTISYQLALIVSNSKALTLSGAGRFQPRRLPQKIPVLRDRHHQQRSTCPDKVAE
jgi:hypothetical protein